MRFLIFRIFTIALLAMMAPLNGAFAQVSLDASGVNGGAVVVGKADSLTCDASTGGAMRFNDTPDCIEFCDGAGNWACIGGCVVTWDTFADLINQPKSTVIETGINLVTTSGCTPDVDISGDGSPEYRICSAADCSSVVQTWTSTTQTINSGEYLQARMTSSASSGTTNTATVTVGKAATEWTVTTSSTPQFVAAETASSAGTATLTVNKPTGTGEDNLMIAALARDDNGCSMSAPAGWTEIRQDDMGAFQHSRYAYFYKIATASEPADYDFSICDSAESVVGAIVTISGNSTSSPIDVNGGQAGDSATPTAPSITTTVNDTLLVAIATSQYADAHTPPASYTERADVLAGSTNTGASLSIATKVQATAGASGTAAFSTSSDAWHAEHIAVRAP